VEVGRFEGKSAASRVSIKNEGFLIDGDRSMMAGIQRRGVWEGRKEKETKRLKDERRGESGLAGSRPPVL
jgi:hypothetical protein